MNDRGGEPLVRGRFSSMRIGLASQRSTRPPPSSRMASRCSELSEGHGCVQGTWFDPPGVSPFRISISWLPSRLRHQFPPLQHSFPSSATRLPDPLEFLWRDRVRAHVYLRPTTTRRAARSNSPNKLGAMQLLAKMCGWNEPEKHEFEHGFKEQAGTR